MEGVDDTQRRSRYIHCSDELDEFYRNRPWYNTQNNYAKMQGYYNEIVGLWGEMTPAEKKYLWEPYVFASIFK